MGEGANFFSGLPADVFTLILLMLPTKSLITCIAVCKTWNSILKSPEFFSSHLNRTIPEDDSDLCLLQRRTLPLSTGRDSFFLLSKDQNLSVVERIHFPYNDIYRFQAVASCNGLICLRFREGARFHLFTFGESLAVLWIREIWVMKEIGVKESWTQLSTIRFKANPSSFIGLVLTKDACVLLSFGSYVDYSGTTFLHDLKSKETWIIINDRKDAHMFLGDYVESLALLDKGNDFSTHFVIESGDAAAAAAAADDDDDDDDDDTSRTSSSGLNENSVPLDEGNADSSEDPSNDLSNSSISHESDELSGNENDYFGFIDLDGISSVEHGI